MQAALQGAYEDATVRAEETSGIADRMASGDEMYMGDAHGGGRRYAELHVVVPGNPDYLQSAEEFFEAQKD